MDVAAILDIYLPVQACLFSVLLECNSVPLEMIAPSSSNNRCLYAWYERIQIIKVIAVPFRPLGNERNCRSAAAQTHTERGQSETAPRERHRASRETERRRREQKKRKRKKSLCHRVS
jgi:hypothetical protein